MTIYKKKVYGKYTLFGVIPNCTYTLTDSDRQAQFTVTGARTRMNMKAVNSLSVTSNVLAQGQCDLKIVRAMLDPSGAFGLQPSPGKKAASLYLDIVTEENGNLVTLDQVALNFTKWGEWINVNKTLRPYLNKGSASVVPDMCNFSVNPDDSEFNVDDYNIDSAYNGENVTPIINLEVETAGLWDSSIYNLF